MFLLPFLAVLYPVGAEKQASFDVTASVISGWPRTAPEAQSLEWLRDVDAAEAALWLGSGRSTPIEALLKSSSARTYHELLMHNSYYSPRIESLRSLERIDRKLYGQRCDAMSRRPWALIWRNHSTTPSVACNVKELRLELSRVSKGPSDHFTASRLDLTLAQGTTSSGVLVIYGALDDPELGPFLEASRQPNPFWQVIFRHADGAASDQQFDLLTGYGFELAIKSSEYKTHAEEKVETVEASDDAGDEEEDATEKNGTRGVASDEEEDSDQILKNWQIKDIGLQASTKIKSSKTPLLTLMRLSQNFPAQVVGLSKRSVSKSLRRKSDELRQFMRDGAEVFSMNGRLVRPDHSELSLFPLMQTLHPFFVGVERLVRLGISERVACEILKEVKGSGKAPQRLDWRSKALPPPVYQVLKDKDTQRWSSSLRSLFFGFGGLSPVRLPLYNLVFVFDPAEVEDLGSALALLKQMPLPANLHFVMTTASTAELAWEEEVLGSKPSWLSSSQARSEKGQVSQTLASTFAYMLAKGRKRVQSFLTAAHEWVSSLNVNRWPETEEGLQKIKELWLASFKKEAPTEDTWLELLRNGSAVGGYVANCSDYAASTGVPVPSLLVNGKIMLKGAYSGQHAVLQSVAEEQQRIQQAVYMGALTDSSDVSEFFVSQGVLSAYHPEISPDMAESGGEEGVKEQMKQGSYHLWVPEPFLKLTFVSSLEPEVPEVESDPGEGVIAFYHVLVLRGMEHVYMLKSLASHFLAPERLPTKGQTFASHLAVLIDESQGPHLKVLASCLRAILGLKAESDDAEEIRSLNRQKLSVLKFLGTAIPIAMQDPQLPAERLRDLCRLALQKKLPRPGVEALISQDLSSPEEDLKLLQNLAGQNDPDAVAIWVCNGRRIDLQAGGQAISARHVHALELLEGQYDLPKSSSEEPEESEEEDSKEVEVTTKALSQWLADESASLPASVYGLVAAIRSEVLSHAKHDRFTQPAKIFERAPAAFRVKIPPAKPDAASPITVYGILDPLSTTAQSASAALALFGMAFNAEVNLVLNPTLQVEEYPLKRYYREVVRWPERLADGRLLSDVAEEANAQVGRGIAEFTLATQHTLTAAVHALPTWLVTAHEAEHDMDNLRPVDVLSKGGHCQTTYALRQLYVEGQAMILGEEGWPIATAKGMQFEITGKGALEASDDTIVMGNLGYFQVRGDPGFYRASLKSGSNDTFQLVTTDDLEVSSYITPPHQLRVKMRPGKSHEDLFEGKASKKSHKSGSSIIGALQSLLGGEGAGNVVKASDGEETIHIFSVASGHLYEKLLGIMILSVRNNTQNPLHFWLIDNFLSPKFKAFIPMMAQRYDFKYDFVTYKWPSWLNPQSEKQRLIWAYKILFLDVLFPQDVPKIIFIDADQVVRADVKELWDLDLQGKVYGFVPMGDSNPDTEGFRFWKQGYWKSHLGTMPYHISALFVVDLVEFRRTSTGETLRGVYNQLSRDPNSLANLDQDLPNFAQHQVPIFTLPSEWLWCETWCSQESKDFAKTIDLCQNPLTKEPKIVMAKRIISEWQTFHNEVQALQEEHDNMSAVNPAVAGKAEL